AAGSASPDVSVRQPIQSRVLAPASFPPGGPEGRGMPSCWGSPPPVTSPGSPRSAGSSAGPGTSRSATTSPPTMRAGSGPPGDSSAGPTSTPGPRRWNRPLPPSPTSTSPATTSTPGSCGPSRCRRRGDPTLPFRASSPHLSGLTAVLGRPTGAASTRAGDAAREHGHDGEDQLDDDQHDEYKARVQ